jgi:NAD(P)H dehydrogenase (quinone)
MTPGAFYQKCGKIPYMILLTGASGKTGKTILHSLAAKGEMVRAVVHTPQQMEAAQQAGASHVAVANLLDVQDIQQAALGAQSIYHICPNMHPEEVRIGEVILQAARSAGVERFVYHSVLHPQVKAMPHHWSKLRVEEGLFASGLNFTILQPAAYMENILAYKEAILSTGEYAVPYAVETCLSMVALEDIAEIAVKVLTSSGHENAIYELTGTKALSQEEVAGIIGQRLNRTVKAVAVPRSVWEQHARTNGMTDYALQTLMQMFEYYERFGFYGNPHILTSLLGRSPLSFNEFVEKYF